MEDCLSGDAQAQQELYNKYVQAMYNVTVRMVNNSEDASDIIQEVFVKVFRNLSSFQGESTLGAWIKKITVNTTCLLYTSPSPRDATLSRMPSSA